MLRFAIIIDKVKVHLKLKSVLVVAGQCKYKMDSNSLSSVSPQYFVF